MALGGSSLETRAGRLDSLLNVLSGRMDEGELVTLRAKLQCMTGFPKHDKRFLVYLIFNFCSLKFSERAFTRYHPRLCSRSPKRCWADIAWGAMDQPTAANSCLLGLRPQWKCFLNWFDSNLELILFELSNATHWEVFSAKLANSLFVFLSLRYLCDG